MSASALPDLAQATAGPGRVGPNAMLQLVPALAAAGLAARTPALFAAAGAGDWLAEPPAVMLDERQVAALHRTLRAQLPPALARAVLADAGRRTGDYVLAHRIPAPARCLIRALPRPLAARALIAAIWAHAWTFVGSGRLTARPGRPAILAVTANPLAAAPGEPAGGCVWHATAFQQLFRGLVHPQATVRETACAAHGAEVCRFEIHAASQGST